MLRAFEQAYSISSTAKFLAKKKVAITYAATPVYSNKTNGTHTASSWLVVTRCSTPLCVTLARILDTATSDKSLAMISLTPGTSLAYRMLRRPDADKASNIVRPFWNKNLQCIGKDSSFRIWTVWDRASVHRLAVITTLPAACHESVYANGQILSFFFTFVPRILMLSKFYLLTSLLLNSTTHIHLKGPNICSHITTVLMIHWCILMDYFNNCNFCKPGCGEIFRTCPDWPWGLNLSTLASTN